MRTPLHEPDAALVDAANRYLAQSVPRIIDLDIRVLELRPDRMVTFAPLSTNGNHLGSMYAGTLFGMAELMGGMILMPSVDFETHLPTVKDVAIRYRRPACTDITATATLAPATLDRIRAEAGEQGRAEYQIDATLTDDHGTVVATTTGTYVLLSTAQALRASRYA